MRLIDYQVGPLCRCGQPACRAYWHVIYSFRNDTLLLKLGLN
jgi:hypothetical protein